MLAPTSRDKKVLVWDPTNGPRQRMLEGQLDTATAIQFSPDGSELALVSLVKIAIAWDLKRA